MVFRRLVFLLQLLRHIEGQGEHSGCLSGDAHCAALKIGNGVCEHWKKPSVCGGTDQSCSCVTASEPTASPEAPVPKKRSKRKKVKAEMADVSYEYIAVVDCGSSGTRVHVLYMVPGDNRSPDPRSGVSHGGRVSDSLVGAIEPAAHSYSSGSEAAAPIINLLRKGLSNFVPPKRGHFSKVMIRGTGGLRSASGGSSILSDLQNAVKTALGDKTSVDGKLLSGEEEAYYALLAGNYIAGALDAHSLLIEPDKGFGVLDLGGSSLQVSIPFSPAEIAALQKQAQREHELDEDSDFPEPTPQRQLHHNPSLAPGVVLKSFAGYGLDSAYEKVAKADSKGVCNLNPETGDGRACFDLINQVMFDVDNPFKSLVIPESQKFAAIEWPEVAWGNILEGASSICSADERHVKDAAYDAKLGTGHRFTNPRELAGRCFHVAYIAAVFKALGFGSGERQVHFNFIKDDRPVEWPIGLFIADFHARDVKNKLVPGGNSEALKKDEL